MSTPIKNPEVITVFDRYSESVNDKLMMLRDLIYEVASTDETVGELEETLKWGQPSYLTPNTKSGTTIRIDQVKNQPEQYAMYLNCQTTLIETFRQLYPDFTYEGTRAIIFDVNDSVPQDALKDCIHMALTYHLKKKQKSQ